MTDNVVGRLRELLAKVRLDIVDDAVVYEGKRSPLVKALPLDDLDPDAEAGELMAIAAGLEAAVKFPARVVPNEDLRTGAATLLPKLERKRFALAYDAVCGERDPILWSDFGGGLATVYVEDQGWKFQVLGHKRFAQWDTTMGTVHSVARSNLYHRAALDWQAREVALGDGYDAARAIVLGDVFYDRAGADGIVFAVPAREVLIVAAKDRPLSPDAVRQAYEQAKYPLSPEIFAFAADHAKVLRAEA